MSAKKKRVVNPIPEDKPLTLKQKRLADEFIKTGNATQSAITAGYTVKSAKTVASQTLAKSNVKRYIADRLAEIDKQTIIDQQDVLLFLSNVVKGNVPDQFGLEASIKDRTDAAKELLKVFEKAVKTTGNDYEDLTPALDMLMKGPSDEDTGLD